MTEKVGRVNWSDSAKLSYSPWRAILTPWHRGVTYVGLGTLGLVLLVLGMKDPVADDWAINTAWVPLTVAALLAWRWQHLAAKLARGTAPGAAAESERQA